MLQWPFEFVCVLQKIEVCGRRMRLPPATCEPRERAEENCERDTGSRSFPHTVSLGMEENMVRVVVTHWGEM